MNNKIDTYRCKTCSLIPFIYLFSKSNVLYIKYKCLNNHEEILTLNKFMKENNFNLNINKCKFCSTKKELYFCYECSGFVCFNCLYNGKNIHIKNNHKNSIVINDYDSYCVFHKKKFDSFCLDCNQNICYLCIDEETHINHNKINFIDIRLTKSKILNLKTIIENSNKYIDNIKDIKNLINKLESIYNEFLFYNKKSIEFINELLNIYEKKKGFLNFQIIKNIENNFLINPLNNNINFNNIINNFKNLLSNCFCLNISKKNYKINFKTNPEELILKRTLQINNDLTNYSSDNLYKQICIYKNYLIIPNNKQNDNLFDLEIYDLLSYNLVSKLKNIGNDFIIYIKHYKYINQDILIILFYNSIIKIYDLNTLQLIKIFIESDISFPIYSFKLLTLNNKDYYLITNSNNFLKIYNFEDKKLIHTKFQNNHQNNIYIYNDKQKNLIYYVLNYKERKNEIITSHNFIDNSLYNQYEYNFINNKIYNIKVKNIGLFTFLMIINKNCNLIYDFNKGKLLYNVLYNLKILDFCYWNKYYIISSLDDNNIEIKNYLNNNSIKLLNQNQNKVINIKKAKVNNKEFLIVFEKKDNIKIYSI